MHQLNMKDINSQLWFFILIKNKWDHFDGLAQYCGNSSALALESLLFCIKPPICWKPNYIHFFCDRPYCV